MDFGSSHVYAGEQPATYYSSVPKENNSKIASSKKNEPIYDPVYESIGEAKKNLSNPNQKKSATESEYDLVADDKRNNDTAWDEIRSNNPPPIPVKPSIYSTQSTQKTGDNVSLASRLRQALEKREKEKKTSNPNDSAGEVDDSLGRPPKKPPRKKKDKAAAAVPQPIRKAPPPPLKPSLPPRKYSHKEVKLDEPPQQSASYEEVKPNDPPEQSSSYEEVNWEESSKTKSILDFDSLIDFSNDCVIPALAPPPVIEKSAKCLPNVPYNPFGEVVANSSDVITDVPLLQPTVVNGLRKDTTGSTTVATNSTSNGFLDSFNWTNGDESLSNDHASLVGSNLVNGTSQNINIAADSSQPVQDNFSNFNATSQEENLFAFAATPIEDILNSNKSRQQVVPNHYEKEEPTVNVDCATSQHADTLSLSNPFHTSSQPTSVFSAQTSDSKSSTLSNGWGPTLTPTAPSLSSSMSALKPSAPSRTPSMMQRDEKIKVERSSSRASSSDAYATADTNVVCIKLGIVADNQGTYFTNAIPSQCVSCKGINNSAAEKWECVFCSVINKTHVSAIPANSANDVTYMVHPPTNTLSPPESLIVFCVDTSGSMGVTSQVNSFGSAYFLSRLKALQQAITDQLNLIEAKRPNTRVALVTFNDDVSYHGDGSSDQKLVHNEFQLYDVDFLTHTGAVTPLPGLIRDSRMKLAKAVSDLKTSGGTALGPALLLSTALASKLPGSQVIVCTDGRANVGVGSLETEDDYSMCHHFYDQTTLMAATHGVIVNVLAIAGEDCRLVQLGKIADRTAGKVNIVENTKISEEFFNILSDSVLATSVSIELVTHRQLYFKHKTQIVGSTVAQFVGNITNNSEVTFQYGARTDEEFATMPPPLEAPFQLKIIYRNPDGGVYVRVLTQVRPVTENRELAETEMNPAVIGTFAAQYAARLALEGDLDNAKEVTNAHKDLVSRGQSLKSHYSSVANEAIYDCVRKRMDDIGSELTKADTASTCSSENTYNDPDIIEEDLYESDELAPAPALPPRRQNSTPEHHTSMSSIQAKLAKLPSISKVSFGKKKKRNKSKTAMQYKDKTAVKMFKISKAHSSSFAQTS